MEEVDRKTAVLEVVAEDIGIVALLGRGDALFFLELMNRGKLIAQSRRGLELLGLGSCSHARRERALQLRVTAFEKKLRIAHRLRIRFRRCEALDAGTETAMNVVLQAGARVISARDRPCSSAAENCDE